MVATPTSAPHPDDNELPNLLVTRHTRHCKTLHGNRKLAPESKSTGTFLGAHGKERSLVSQLSFESSKSLGANSKIELSPSDESMFDSVSPTGDQCHKAFPLKAPPVKRWR